MIDDQEEIAEEIDAIVEKWEHVSNQYTEDHFGYGEEFIVKHPSVEDGRLMKVFNTDANDTRAFNTMTSMRSVDASVAGNVLIWEE